MDTTVPDTDHLLPVNTQSIVPNLHIIAMEADLICGELTGHSIPAPLICAMLLDKASTSKRIFIIAFPTLYPIGYADFNSPCL
jgi:hypothetical protein